MGRPARGTVGAAVVAAVLAAGVGGAAPAGAQTPAADRTTAPARASAVADARVYVANQDDATVTVVDAATLERVATVPIHELAGSGNAKPHHVVVEPDGSHWYVSLIGANRVLKLDRQNRVVGEAAFEVPGMLSLDPGSHCLFVGRSMSAVNPPQRIGVIDRRDMTVEEIAVLYPRPHALAAHPGEGLAYSASLAENTMAVVDAAQADVEIVPVPAPSDAAAPVHTLVQLAVSPDGRTLVGTGELSDRLLVFDLSDPRRPTLVKQVAVGARPWHPVFTPDGSEVWFANKGTNTVTVVETDGWTVAAVVEDDGLVEPHGAAISPDGARVFVSSSDLRGGYPGPGGTLTVIDRVDRRVVEVIPVGRNAAGVGTNARR